MSAHAEVFDCSRCTEAAKREKGCHEDTKIPAFEYEGEKYHRCPARLVAPWTRWVLEMFMHYRSGYLPYGGGVMEQPPKLMRAFAVIGSTMAEVEAEKAKKRK